MNDLKLGDLIEITNPRKPYLNNGEIYEVVDFTKKMKYPYVLVNGMKRYVGSGEYRIYK